MSHLNDSRYYDNLKGKHLHEALYGGDFTSGLGNFTKAWGNRVLATGKAYYGSPGLDTVKAFIPNLTDSMSQLYPDSSDFNQALYDMLTDKEKETVISDKMLSLQNPLYMIPFIGLFQDTRESVDEMLGVRHPEILKNAINRYNAKIEKDRKDKEYADIQQMIALQNRDNVEYHVQNGNKSNENFPTINLVNADAIPIDSLHGRGLPVHHTRIRHKININY